uniref:NB-ARC domain-containing protein n=2 Tax=Hordeum vulgare subsp. vulgare TaxID=112509 RepID=A0A8I6WYA2_HORVV
MVWGMPGVGKTTLVDHVYNIVKEDFDVAAWVTVSENYRIEDLLKKIAAQFSVIIEVTNIQIRGLAKSIHNYLESKNYILVLDDVWDERLWSEIRDVFSTSNCTSRVVMTSRKQTVLATREFAYRIHLEPLQAHHSWVLFCKGAFWNVDEQKCPLELHELAWKFIAKSQGLPIAIACIGRLLSCKPQNSAEWEDVYRCLDSQLAKDVIPDAHMILKVSLEDLPFDLKNCFLHCALSPEDYVLKRRKTMRQWITVGFITERDESKTLEEVAEGYLVELVNRSLLQVVERNYAGRLKYCRMHDVIRLLALNKAKEECFGKVYNGTGGTRAFSVEGARRISVQAGSLEQLSPSGATKLRALHVFENDINVDLLKHILTSSNLLSTLDLQGTNIKMLPNEVFDLFNLRYLGLRDTLIESMPEALGRLQNLEVLDAGHSKLTYLPKSVVKLQKLRHLYACTLAGTIGSIIGVKVPGGMQHLAGLRALQSVKATPEFLREVGALTELRTFDVCSVQSGHSADLSNAITRMRHLVHLEIGAAAENEVLRLERLYLPPTLSWLSLEGQLEKTSMPQLFSSWSHLNSLTRLTLAFSNIDEETFSCLHVLSGLRFLQLWNAFKGKRLDFHAGSFPKLSRLHICGTPQLSQVGIEEGAMQELVELLLADCPKLKFLPDGIEHLAALEKLLLYDTSEELIEKLRQNRDSNECSQDEIKISHIRIVTVALSYKGLAGRIR